MNNKEEELMTNAERVISFVQNNPRSTPRSIYAKLKIDFHSI